MILERIFATAAASVCDDFIMLSRKNDLQEEEEEG